MTKLASIVAWPTAVLVLLLGCPNCAVDPRAQTEEPLTADQGVAVTPQVDIVKLSGHYDLLTAIALTRDGRFAVTSSLDQSLRYWDLNSGKELRRLGPLTQAARVLAIDLSGSYAVTGALDRIVRLWDLKTGQEQGVFSGLQRAVSAVGISPKGERIVGASHDGTILIWDLKSRQRVGVLVGHSQPVGALCFSPDGRFLASAGDDQKAIIWDLASLDQAKPAGPARVLKPKLVLKGHQGWVTSVDFSDDAQYLVTASADRTIRLWDAKKGSMINVFKGHRSSVARASFIPGARVVVTGGGSQSADRDPQREDFSVRVFALQSGIELARYEGHKGPVVVLQQSPKGQLLSASLDESIRVWPLPGPTP